MKHINPWNVAYKMHEEWVGSIHNQQGNGPDFDRIHRSMLQEYRHQKTIAGRADLVREIKGQLILLGKIRKATGNCKA